MCVPFACAPCLSAIVCCRNVPLQAAPAGGREVSEETFTYTRHSDGSETMTVRRVYGEPRNAWRTFHSMFNASRSLYNFVAPILAALFGGALGLGSRFFR
jgi:hypothetical protein